MKKKHVYLLLCFFWMALIFWFSAQEGDNSQGMSNRIIAILDSMFHTHILEGGGILEDTVSFLVRKAAHMSEYAVLGILFAAYLKEIGMKRYTWIALLGVVLYASSDEFHQLFVVGRSGQLQDVWIDTLGGSLGLLVHRLYVIIFRRQKM